MRNQNEPLGHALFPLFSRLEHNCSSNCRVTVTSDGRFVTVRAVRHISEGEHLSIDYTNPLLGNLVSRSLCQHNFLVVSKKAIFRLDERISLGIGSLIVSVNAAVALRKWTPICRLSGVRTETDTFCLSSLLAKGQSGNATGVEKSRRRNGLKNGRKNSKY